MQNGVHSYLHFNWEQFFLIPACAALSVVMLCLQICSTQNVALTLLVVWKVDTILEAVPPA